MRSGFVRFGGYGLGLLVALVSVARPVLAVGIVPVAAPEIDGGSLTTGLGLLAAAIMIVRSRRRARSS